MTVVVSGLSLPTCTFPKLRVEGDALSERLEAVPVPVSEIAICAGEPFVVSVIDPVEEPAAVGVNTALKFSVAPAATVVDVVSPDTLKPEPVALTCEKVSVALPVFFNVTTLESLFPTTTLPKATLVGLAEPSACRPVPLSAIAAGDPGALLVIEMLPATLPSAVGANVTEKVVLAPALMLVGVSVMV